MKTGMMKCSATSAARPAARKAAPLSARKAPVPHNRNVAAHGWNPLDNAGKEGSGNTEKARPVKADDPPGRQIRKTAYKAKEMAADGVGQGEGPPSFFKQIRDFFRTKPDVAPFGDNAGKAGSGNTQISTQASDPPNRKKMKSDYKAKEDAADGKR